MRSVDWAQGWILTFFKFSDNLLLFNFQQRVAKMGAFPIKIIFKAPPVQFWCSCCTWLTYFPPPKHCANQKTSKIKFSSHRFNIHLMNQRIDTKFTTKLNWICKNPIHMYYVCMYTIHKYTTWVYQVYCLHISLKMPEIMSI